MKRENKEKKKEFIIFPRINNNLFYLVLSFFTYIVITNYYKHNPVNFFILEKYFSIQEFGETLKLQNILHLFNNLENIFYVILIFFSMYILGSKILKFFSLKNIGDEIKVILSISFGTGVILIFIFVIGILGFLYKWVILSIILVLDILGIFEILVRRSKNLNFNLSLHKLSTLERLQLVLCILMFFVILVGCLLPEIFYDSLVYHLAKPNFWIQNHKLIPDKSYMMSFFYPGNSNLLFVIGLFFKDETICKLINFSFNILTTILLYFLGKKFFNEKVGFLASVIFFTTPYIGILSWRSAVEMILAFFETITVFTFVMWILEQNYKYLIISAVNCGLAIGTKYTSLYCLTAIICCIILKNISEKKTLKNFLKDIIIFLGISILVASPWLIYNYVYTGNPIYPYLWRFVGYVRPRATHDPIIAGFYDFKKVFSNIIEILKAPWIVSMGQYEEAFTGPVVLLFLPFFVFFKSRWKPTKYIFLYIIVYMSIWKTAHKFYVRYFMPVFAIISFICALYIYESKISEFFRKIFLYVLTFVIFTGVLFVMNIQKFINNGLGYLLGMQTKYEYLNTMKPSYPNPYYGVAEWINKNLPNDVLISFLGEIRSYYVERKCIFFNFADPVPLVDWTEKSANEDELYKKIKTEGVTHILINFLELKRLAGSDNLYFSPEGLKIFVNFWNKYVKEIYRDIADISLPDRGIYSLKKQAPDWWQQYASNPMNYVCLYEIMSEEEAEKPHQPPYNFFLHKEFYSQERWEKLKPVIDEIIADYKTKYGSKK